MNSQKNKGPCDVQVVHQSLLSLFAPGRIARPPFFIALTTHRDLMRDLIKDTPLEKVSRKKKKKKAPGKI